MRFFKEVCGCNCVKSIDMNMFEESVPQKLIEKQPKAIFWHFNF